MINTRRLKMKLARIAIFGILPLFAACGGGGGGGSDAGVATVTPQATYVMWQCTIYRRYDSLSGFGYWTSCPDDNWTMRANQPVYTSLSACEDAIRVEQNSNSVVYDNSDEDKNNGWAVKLGCAPPDTLAPSVLSTSPSEGSSSFAVNGRSLSAEFSDNMDAATINSTTFILEDPTGMLLTGDVTFSRSSRTAWFDPEEPLLYKTSYTARLTTGIKDKVGNPLGSEFSWSFTTELSPEEKNPDVTAPIVISETPLTDSICGLQDGAITVRFNEEIIVAAGIFTLTNSNGELVEGGITHTGFSATFTPTQALDSNEVYTAFLGGEIGDAAGNVITPSSWSFRTEIAPEGHWTKIATPTDVAGRAGHTLVWTGSEMIVWGGYNWDAPSFPWHQYLTDHGRYNPVLDQWSSVSKIDAPRKREQHTATWTGTEMIIWGGVFDQCSVTNCLYSTNTGGRYDPATDSWLPMSTAGAPSPRRYHTAIWTGSELVIWGGFSNDYRTPLSDGARYDPSSDTWTRLSDINVPTGRGYHQAVFDGQQMIIWGGSVNGSAISADGATYDPAIDVWSALPTQNAPDSNRSLIRRAGVVWTGEDMLILSPQQGFNYVQETGEWIEYYDSETRRYSPQKQQWTTVVDACNPRATSNALWVDGRLMSWNSGDLSGHFYDERLDTWGPITAYPEITGGARFVNAGDSVIGWGGTIDTNINPNNNTRALMNIGYRLTQ